MARVQISGAFLTPEAVTVSGSVDGRAVSVLIPRDDLAGLTRAQQIDYAARRLKAAADEEIGRWLDLNATLVV